MNIGFIGLGNMGNPMAMNLLKAQHNLTVYDIVPEAAQNLVAAGARLATDLADLCQGQELIICSLPGPKQIEPVILGEQGILELAAAGTTLLDMSTNAPEMVKAIARKGAEKGIATLEGPISEGVDAAEEGRLSIYVGGDQAVFEQVLPVLKAMGERIFYTGAHGTANSAKLLTNLLWFINAVAIGEGLMIGAKAGIELTQLMAIIRSSAGNSWVAEHDIPSIFEGHYDPSFSLDLCSKDLNLIHDLARQLDVPIELGALVQQIFNRARLTYGGSQGELHVVKLLEDATQTSLQVEGFTR